jgi:hypothetical protein
MSALLTGGTEAVMAERRGRSKDRPAYTCHGICGQTLRPWRRTAAQFPNTRMEYSANRCIGCWFLWMREQEPDNEAYALLPCSTEGCGNITRPERAPLETAPGTLRRIHGTACATCTGPNRAKKSTEHIEAGLEKFLARMRSDAAKVKSRRSR